MSVFAGLLLIVLAGTTVHGTPLFNGRFAAGIDQLLAADSLEGRKTGQPGGRRAEEFAAARFREWGLRPGVRDSSYFQPFTFLSTQLTAPPELSWVDAPPGELRYAYGPDFVVLLYSGAGDVTGEVVFVGYGITAPEHGHDDYAGLDVNGKIVLALRGAPHDGVAWLDEKSNGYKARNAARHGAKGYLCIQGDSPVLGTLQERFFEPDLPAAWLAMHVARDLFLGTGRSLDDLAAAAGQGRVVSCALGHRVRLAVQSDVLKEARGRNVVARIAGTDATLKRECVVIGAHLDHLGRDGVGRIYPGADDNGSGASTVLELAHEAVRGAWKPHRTVYFCLFGCEEQGLQGSTFLAEHAPPESIAVMLNMDMVGAGDPVPNLGGADRWPELVKVARACMTDSARAKSQAWGSGPDSDHWPFSERGIPSLFTVSHGSHPYYHQVEDKGWRIQPEVLEGVGRFEQRVLETLADTSAYRVDAHRMSHLVARLGRTVARVRWDEHRRGLREAASRGAGLVLLAMPPAEPLLMAARVGRMEQEFGVDSSTFRLAKTAADLDDHAGRGKVSVVLEAQVGSFDLQDSTLIGFLKMLGVRAIVPESTPTPAEARAIAAEGMLLDQTQLRVPLAGPAPSLYSGRVPAGAAHGFEFCDPHDARPDAARQGFLLSEEPFRVAARLLQRKWGRESVENYLGLNFARFWREVP